MPTLIIMLILIVSLQLVIIIIEISKGREATTKEGREKVTRVKSEREGTAS